eukprot:TRINITY_DN24206_c0_g1_i1.p3 TRINITY_DN24206_c0_g1~~TRINITY_DN24206_c0_g1_i1.p3  ORF type:complete len:155 (+),score=8.41 TRINITY_DN24206_c0_g1_i1:1-465(+)
MQDIPFQQPSIQLSILYEIYACMGIPQYNFFFQLSLVRKGVENEQLFEIGYSQFAQSQMLFIHIAQSICSNSPFSKSIESIFGNFTKQLKLFGKNFLEKNFCIQNMIKHIKANIIKSQKLQQQSKQNKKEKLPNTQSALLQNKLVQQNVINKKQ